MIFCNISWAQKNCPEPISPNTLCEEENVVAEVNLSKLWGGNEDCVVYVPYKERICFSSPNGVFEIHGMELDEKNWENFDPTSPCGQLYLKYKNSIATQSTVDVDRFDVRLQHILSEAALEFSAKRAFAQNPGVYNCPSNFMSGKFYYGACAVSCMKWEEFPVSIENPRTIYYLRTTRIVCGENCCTATQTFCKNPDGTINKGKQKFSSSGICVTSTAVSGCGKKQGYFGKSNCVSACEFDFGMKIAAPQKDEIYSKDLSSQDKQIKVNVQNNNITHILSVGFVNSFNGTFTLFDVNGRVVYSHNTNVEQGDLMQIETDNFSAGIYLVSLQSTQNDIVTEKIYIK